MKEGNIGNTGLENSPNHISSKRRSKTQAGPGSGMEVWHEILLLQDGQLSDGPCHI